MPSTSRANGVAAAPAATRAPPKKWQFVNLNKPKKMQDKDVLSVVRSHAMRDVRRKQRLELVAEHQKNLKDTTQQCHDTDAGMTAEHPINPSPGDWFNHDNEDTEWFSILRETRSMLESTNLGQLMSRRGVENATECDNDAPSPDYWQSYDADNFAAFRPFMFGTGHLGSPKSLVGNGMLDPFNALPVPCGANYNSHVLQHCRCLLRNTFLFGQTLLEFESFLSTDLSIHSYYIRRSQLSTRRPASRSESSHKNMASLRFTGHSFVSCYHDFL